MPYTAFIKVHAERPHEQADMRALLGSNKYLSLYMTVCVHSAVFIRAGGMQILHRWVSDSSDMCLLFFCWEIWRGITVVQ